MTEVKKQPGANWSIYYMDIVSGEKYVMAVFGALDIEAAMKEVHFSFGDGIEDVEIVAIVRHEVNLEDYS